MIDWWRWFNRVDKPPGWEPGQAYDRSHVADCTTCGCTANDHDQSWLCPETRLFRWNRAKRQLRNRLRWPRRAR